MRRFTFLNLCLLLVGAAVVGGVVFWGTGPRHEVHGESNAAPATRPTPPAPAVSHQDSAVEFLLRLSAEDMRTYTEPVCGFAFS